MVATIFEFFVDQFGAEETLALIDEGLEALVCGFGLGGTRLDLETVGTFGPRVGLTPHNKMRGEVGTVGHSIIAGGTNLLASLVNLGGTGRYIHWGVIQISLANLIVILVMIVMLVAAIAIPFPKHQARRK